jgi:hypothetical protein
MPKFIAVVLVITAVSWAAIAGSFIMAGKAAAKIDMPAATLGLGLFTALPVLLMLLFAGVAWKMARQVDRDMADIGLERSILERLNAQGEIFLPQVAAEIHASAEAVRDAVYRLAGKNLLTGYVDWKAQKLFSREAAALNDAGTCPGCGGKLELAGKGVIRCPYCGSEVFLPTS